MAHMEITCFGSAARSYDKLVPSVGMLCTALRVIVTRSKQLAVLTMLIKRTDYELAPIS